MPVHVDYFHLNQNRGSNAGFSSELLVAKGSRVVEPFKNAVFIFGILRPKIYIQFSIFHAEAENFFLHIWLRLRAFLHFCGFYDESASRNFCKCLCLSRKHFGNFDLMMRPRALFSFFCFIYTVNHVFFWQ